MTVAAPCLHCFVMKAVEAYYTDHGERAPDGRFIVDVEHVINKLALCIVEHCDHAGARSQRRRAMKFAHAAIDANAEARRTGNLVEVDIPLEH